MTANRQPSQETRPQSATIDALPNHTLQAKTFSLLPIALVIAVGTLLPSSASFAAKHLAAAKPAAHKKAAAAAASANALPPLAAQTALADNPPELPAKAWLLMDYDSGEILASANADEALPPASLTKMMTSYIVEQALRSGKLGKIKWVTATCYKPRDSIGLHEGPQPVPEGIDYDLWTGPAALTPPTRNGPKGSVHYDWHWFWNYGGGDICVSSYMRAIADLNGLMRVEFTGKTAGRLITAEAWSDAPQSAHVTATHTVPT